MGNRVRLDGQRAKDRMVHHPGGAELPILPWSSGFIFVSSGGIRVHPADSVEWYHRWTESGDRAIRQRILEYSEDGCVATRILLDGIRTLEVRC